MRGKGHMITGDQIVTAGAGIDVVTDHMIVTVITCDNLITPCSHV